MPDKLDLKKQQKDIYAPSAKKVSLLDIGPMNYLMIDGKGAPEGPRYTQVIEALFAVSYTMKFLIKKGPRAIDYGVMPLEGLWWAEDMAHFSTKRDKSQWQWTMMIRQPDFIKQADIDMAMQAATKKKNPANLEGLRFENYTEGPCAQILHIGPFEEEGPTIEQLHAAIEATGHTLSGKHHEIYLSDIRRAAPEKWRTILRQPYHAKTSASRKGD
ncbi:MAG: GyrI-like domain-containing protein [Rhodobacteraceae bacterium]|nr:GyrI-like domain-containing protein [Paracoccaceae bacterium]